MSSLASNQRGAGGQIEQLVRLSTAVRQAAATAHWRFTFRPSFARLLHGKGQAQPARSKSAHARATARRQLSHGASLPGSATYRQTQQRACRDFAGSPSACRINLHQHDQHEGILPSSSSSGSLSCHGEALATSPLMPPVQLVTNLLRHISSAPSRTATHVPPAACHACHSSTASPPPASCQKRRSPSIIAQVAMHVGALMVHIPAA